MYHVTAITNSRSVPFSLASTNGSSSSGKTLVGSTTFSAPLRSFTGSPAFAFSTSAGGRKELISLMHTMRPSSASPATSTDTCVLVSCTKLAVGFNSAPASLWHLRCGIGSLPV